MHRASSRWRCGCSSPQRTCTPALRRARVHGILIRSPAGKDTRTIRKRNPSSAWSVAAIPGEYHWARIRYGATPTVGALRGRSTGSPQREGPDRERPGCETNVPTQEEA